MIQRRSRNCVALGFVEEHVDVLQELQSPHGVNPSESLFIEYYTFKKIKYSLFINIFSFI